MARKASKSERRQELGLPTYEEWQSLPVGNMNRKAQEVFDIANKRLRSLRSVRKFDYTTVPAYENVESAFNLGTFSSRGKKHREFKDVSELPRHELASAYRAALDFVSSATSELESARRVKQAEKTNIAKALKVGSQIAGRLLVGSPDDLYEPVSYLKSYGDLLGEDKGYNIIRHSGIEKSFYIKETDDIYSAFGKALNTARELVEALGYTTSPIAGSADNGKNRSNIQLVDIMAGYLFSKDLSLSLEEIVQLSVDDFLELQGTAKDAGGTSKAVNTMQSKMVEAARNAGRRSF